MPKFVELKVPLELSFSNTLLIGVFLVFAVTAAFIPGLIGSNLLFTLQLTLAVPLLASSSLVRIKLVTNQESSVLDSFGHLVFVLGYAALINSIGLLISYTTSAFAGMIFLVVNILLALLYSSVLISDRRDTLGGRLAKDLLFITILLFFGLMPIYHYPFF